MYRAAGGIGDYVVLGSKSFWDFAGLAQNETSNLRMLQRLIYAKIQQASHGRPLLPHAVTGPLTFDQLRAEVNRDSVHQEAGELYISFLEQWACERRHLPQFVNHVRTDFACAVLLNVGNGVDMLDPLSGLCRTIEST